LNKLIEAEDPPAVIRPDLPDRAAERWEPWTDRLSVALVELVMSETVLYEDDGLSDGSQLLAGACQGRVVAKQRL
jgi:hypothetical protein